MKYLRLFMSLLGLLSTQAIASKADSDVRQYSYGDCLLEAANHYQVSPDLINAIIKTESNHQIDAINVNTRGSEDVGLMQINSEWLPRIKKLGYDRSSLFDPCTNITVGTWILAQEVQRFGYTWIAVGAYNAGPSKKQALRRERYATRVYNNLSR